MSLTSNNSHLRKQKASSAIKNIAISELYLNVTYFLIQFLTLNSQIEIKKTDSNFNFEIGYVKKEKKPKGIQFDPQMIMNKLKRIENAAVLQKVGKVLYHL